MTGAGNLDQLITIQARTATPDGGGGSVIGYADLLEAPEVWAEVKPLRGSEQFSEGRTNAVGGYLFIIYNRSDIDETCRILWQGSPYNIRAVMRAGVEELYLKIEAERGVA